MLNTFRLHKFLKDMRHNSALFTTNVDLNKSSSENLSCIYGWTLKNSGMIIENGHLLEFFEPDPAKINASSTYDPSYASDIKLTSKGRLAANMNTFEFIATYFLNYGSLVISCLALAGSVIAIIIAIKAL